ncbi:aminopeptidase N-like [Bacillus rossius redtenbacheri]|uniref:aminopeptidase N-like n=1 Tax=Bacillus rossius redtenbacheri TaxID=93214 RepID=UPI002FDE183C
MRVAEVLLVLLVLWCSSCGASLDAADALRHQHDFYLPRAVVPRAYRVRLVPRLEEGDFSGEVWARVSCLEASDSITLHAHQDLNTTSAGLSVRRLPADPASNDSEEVPVSSTKKNFAKQWYIIMLGEKLQRGVDYELHVAFSGKLDSAVAEAFFRGSYVDQRSQETSWYAATSMKTTKARQVFPCFDEPALKASFQISVAARRKYHVWSNMPLKDTQDMEDKPGWLWHHFPATPLMSTFSVGVFISDFHYTSSMIPNGYIRLSSRPELLESLEKINRLSAVAFNFAEEFTNVSYPLEKLDVVVLPVNSSDFLANSWGLIMMRESDLEGAMLGRLVARAVLTQWAGHLASPYWWSAVSLSSALVDHLAAQQQSATAESDGCPLDTSLTDSEAQHQAATGHEYAHRVFQLLRLLNYSLTGDVFRQGISSFLEDRQYKTFTEHDLWAALMAKGRQLQALPDGIDMQDVAMSWLGKQHRPVLTVTRDYEANTAVLRQHVFLRERPHNIPGKDRMLWYIPVMYVSGDNSSATDLRPTAWLRNERQITVEDLPGPESFVVVNPEQIGEFAVNYDAANWALVSGALRDGSLSECTRAQVLGDAWGLALAGELGPDAALDLALFLQGERSPRVWARFLAEAQGLACYLGGTEAAPLFAEYARILTDRCLRMLGPAAQGEDESARQTREAAERFLDSLSEEQHNASLDQVYAAWVESSDPAEYARSHEVPFERVLRWASLEQFRFVLEYALKLLELEHEQEARGVFQALAASTSQHSEKTEWLLKELLLTDYAAVPEDVRRSCLDQLSRGYNSSRAVFHFVQDNWDELRHSLDGNPELWKLLMKAATARFVTQEDLDAFSELYVQRRGHFGSAELLVERALDRMREDAEWTSDNVPVVHRWLEDFLESSAASLDP